VEVRIAVFHLVYKKEVHIPTAMGGHKEAKVIRCGMCKEIISNLRHIEFRQWQVLTRVCSQNKLISTSRPQPEFL